MTAEPLETVLRSATKEVVIGHQRRFCIIGERINPTGRRIFQEQLRAGDMSAIERDVRAQVEGGADVLDVNMGVPMTDEPELLAKAITLVQSLTDKPVCIDSSVVEALEAGLRDEVIVMVGGAPVTQEYADAVGADGYAPDASATVKKAKDLLKQRRALVNA